MTFSQWLQVRLNHHGAEPRLTEDGIIGPLTRQAITRFQSRSGLDLTGTADNATVDALRNDPIGAVDVPDIPEPAEDMPPWLEEMTRRMGLHEKRDNKTLSDWLRIGRYLGNPAKLPWCGDAVETCFARTLGGERLPDNPFWAQAWKDFGGYLPAPKVGAVGVIRWSAKAGHVGFVIGWNRGATQIKLRGGNQSDMIKDAWFPASKFIAYRWPKTYPFKEYPMVHGSASSGGSTR